MMFGSHAPAGSERHGSLEGFGGLFENTMVLHWCYIGVTLVFHMLQWCHSGVMVVFHWWYSDVTVVVHCRCIALKMMSQ
jgi:hypothetical protein